MEGMDRVHILLGQIQLEFKPETVAFVHDDGETVRRVVRSVTRAPIRDATLDTTTISILEPACDAVRLPLRRVYRCVALEIDAVLGLMRWF